MSREIADKLRELQKIETYDQILRALVAMAQVQEYRESAERILRNINYQNYKK